MSSGDDLELKELRSRIDRLDAAILRLITDRLKVVRDVAYFKRDNQIPMMAKGRLDLVRERAERHGRLFDVDPAFLHRVYDIILEESCRLEDEIIEGARLG